MDELLTRDSSRFWAVGEYATGGSPASFDKQFLRDWLEQSGWDKRPPAPELPTEVIAGTAARYREALTWLTGKAIEGRALLCRDAGRPAPNPPRPPPTLCVTAARSAPD